MAKEKIVGIDCTPVEGVMGAYKYTKSDWTMTAYTIPRHKLNCKFTDKELYYNSIYFLYGCEDNVEKIYVGQGKIRNNGEGVLRRLREHNDSTTERYRNIWEDVIIITSERGDWGATQLNALEHAFYEEIPMENNLNGNNPNKGGHDEKTDYSEKLRQAKTFLKFIGVNVFEKNERTDIPEPLLIVKYNNSKEDSLTEDLQNGMARIPEITTPRKVVKAMVDLIPKEKFVHTTRFIDLACKGGEYLKELYDRLMESEEVIAAFPNQYMRSQHILEEQLYGIALSSTSYDRASRNLYCSAKHKRNIRIIHNYTNVIKGKESKLVNILAEEFGENMRFDVVIGNPPYQESTGSGLNESGGKALFNHFISKAVELSDDIVCMITPTKWLAGNTKEFVELRAKLLEGNHISKMVDYMNAKDIFYNNSIAGGVSYFIYSKNYSGETEFNTIINDKIIHSGMRKMPPYDIIPRHSLAASVINKIKEFKENTMDNVTYKDRWKLSTDFCDGSIVRTSDTDIKVITPQGEYYIDESNYNDKLIDTYKVMFTRVITEHAVEPLKDGKYNILSSLQVINPGVICNASYMVVGGIKHKEHAENIKTYLETKFVRFLILQTLFGIGLTSDRFRYVPLQDFSQPWTDEKLYQKYNLSSEEIEFIEKIIKPIITRPRLDQQIFTAALVNGIVNK